MYDFIPAGLKSVSGNMIKIFDMIHNVCYIRYVELYFALRPVKIVMQVLCFFISRQVFIYALVPVVLYIVVCENSNISFIFSMETGTCLLPYFLSFH